MILDAQGKPVNIPEVTHTLRPEAPATQVKPKMHTCLFCHRRSRLGTHCCNARYREDSKFNTETVHQRLDRLEIERARYAK